MKLRNCEVCGNEFEDYSKFKPTKYCSTPCGNYSKFKTALEDALIEMQPTKEATTLIRGDMFRFANILSKKKEIL